MNTIRIIENRVWENADTGAKASVYGACPYWGSDPGAWEIVTTGYTPDLLRNERRKHHERHQLAGRRSRFRRSVRLR